MESVVFCAPVEVGVRIEFEVEVEVVRSMIFLRSRYSCEVGVFCAPIEVVRIGAFLCSCWKL